MDALIIDDHKINRSLLKILIQDHFPNINITSEADSVAASLKLLETKNYDIIFLDIELKDGVGFDVLEKLSDFVYVIIISSHREYAPDAFKHNVVDYILKPINILELQKAVKKIFDLHEKSEWIKKKQIDNSENENEKNIDTDLLVNYKNNYLVIPKKDIVYIKADGKCSEIHLINGKTYTSYKNLKEFENVMPEIFVRIHHSYLVNIKYVIQFSRETSLIKLQSGKEILVSVRKKIELFKKFNIF